jgi:hypothetical protein
MDIPVRDVPAGKDRTDSCHFGAYQTKKTAPSRGRPFHLGNIPDPADGSGL